MAQHTHTIRKKIRNAINAMDGVNETVKMLLAIATNTAEEYGHDNVSVKDMKEAAKILLQFGVDVEKDIAELFEKEDKEREANLEDSRYDTRRAKKAVGSDKQVYGAVINMNKD